LAFIYNFKKYDLINYFRGMAIFNLHLSFSDIYSIKDIRLTKKNSRHNEIFKGGGDDFGGISRMG